MKMLASTRSFYGQFYQFVHAFGDWREGLEGHSPMFSEQSVRLSFKFLFSGVFQFGLLTLFAAHRLFHGFDPFFV